MKITQIELPDVLGSAVAVLTNLAEKDDIYIAYWPSSIVVEKYGCDPAPRMRILSKVWKNAIEKGRTEIIAYNILDGHSALVRVE